VPGRDSVINASILFAHANHPTSQQRNQYPQGHFPPAAVWQAASYFAWVKKLQEFQFEIVVDGKLTHNRVRDD